MARYIDYAKIPMQKNDIGAKTIGEYFEKLLLTLWDEQEEFSGKRPFGNSGWEYDVYASLISAGVVDGSLDEEGYVVDVTYSAANDIVCKMIKQIFSSTADVVPKSEPERLIDKWIGSGELTPDEKTLRLIEALRDEAKRYERYYFNHEYDKLIGEAKAEVAREIFAEIEEHIKADRTPSFSRGYYGIINFIAELKKKYTEGDK